MPKSAEGHESLVQILLEKGGRSECARWTLWNSLGGSSSGRTLVARTVVAPKGS